MEHDSNLKDYSNTVLRAYLTCSQVEGVKQIAGVFMASVQVPTEKIGHY